MSVKILELLADFLNHDPSRTHPCFERIDLVIRQSIGLGDDRNQVDLGVQSAHDFDIKGFEGMARRLDEVDACMHAVIHNVHAVDLVLGIKIRVEALFNVLDYRSPRIVVIDKITETWSVYDRKTQTNTILFNIRADGLYRDSLRLDIHAWSFALFWWVQGCIEESVDQGGFPETRFTYSSQIPSLRYCRDIRTNDHDVEVETLAYAFAVPLIWEVCEAHVAR